jgi:SAM-dependent methyltransferase
VLEYGCGQGAVACAVAPLAARHIGIDIDPDGVAQARTHAQRRGLDNVELVLAKEADILERVGEHAGEVDVFLLYAVLEHLTLDERLAVLQTAREVTRADGHIVICETPNRLTAIDHHTAQMPFFHALPADLAARWYDRSARADFVAAIDAAAGAGPDALRSALARWGTGMSFHELELVFEDLAAHTVAGGYSPHLYGPRPVRGEELQLAATLDAWRPDLPPAWSRSWLDMILSVTARSQPAVHVRPWQLRVDHDVPGAAMLPDGRVELRPGAWLPVSLPSATDELHVGLMAADPAAALRVRTSAELLAPAAQPPTYAVPPWHATTRLTAPARALELGLEHGGCLTYVGYAGPADPHAAQGRAAGW